MKKADKNLLSGSTTLLVLSLLSSRDKYGYEMIAELEARSDHTFTLKEGTLYP
ncbi:helix-turn-helix transcriptional regulator, partial [Flavonifractor plautii]